MSKRKLFVVNVPATACYKVFATNEIEAKQILMEEAGYSIKAEILFLDDDLRKDTHDRKIVGPQQLWP